jgi:hypothetical protein
MKIQLYLLYWVTYLILVFVTSYMLHKQLKRDFGEDTKTDFILFVYFILTFFIFLLILSLYVDV